MFSLKFFNYSKQLTDVVSKTEQRKLGYLECITFIQIGSKTQNQIHCLNYCDSKNILQNMICMVNLTKAHFSRQPNKDATVENVMRCK